MKKRGLAVLALLALVLGLALLGTVPVYPAFQKELSSMDELQKALRQEAFLYPDDAGLPDADYWLALDGRTLLASSVGYQIESRNEEATAHYTVSGSTRRPSPSGPAPVEEFAYRGVEIGLRKYGDLEDASSFAKLELFFSLDGLFYALTAQLPAKTEKPSPKQRTELAASAKEALLTQCRLMIDSAADT